ncbi:uncharacterized protein LOC134440042 [Engraulis encrasicolus]|uniref:uncharacterized protein LOC134440042 n=1 Tax=Engraulis encrasicolus TaxID=184585 RepID=UPI002FD5EC03
MYLCCCKDKYTVEGETTEDNNNNNTGDKQSEAAVAVVFSSFPWEIPDEVLDVLEDLDDALDKELEERRERREQELRALLDNVLLDTASRAEEHDDNDIMATGGTANVEEDSSSSDLNMTPGEAEKVVEQFTSSGFDKTTGDAEKVKKGAIVSEGPVQGDIVSGDLGLGDTVTDDLGLGDIDLELDLDGINCNLGLQDFEDMIQNFME